MFPKPDESNGHLEHDCGLLELLATLEFGREETETETVDGGTGTVDAGAGHELPRPAPQLN